MIVCTLTRSLAACTFAQNELRDFFLFLIFAIENLRYLCRFWKCGKDQNFSEDINCNEMLNERRKKRLQKEKKNVTISWWAFKGRFLPLRLEAEACKKYFFLRIYSLLLRQFRFWISPTQSEKRQRSMFQLNFFCVNAKLFLSMFDRESFA